LDLRNTTPHPHLPAVLHDERGREVLVVLVKVTVRLSDGAPHPEPLPIHPADVRYPWGAVRYPADLVPSKVGTDIVCNGHVYAPEGKACTDCVAELRIGTLRREVHVTGRRPSPDAAPEALPEPFVRVPLGGERAPGLAGVGPHEEPRRRYRGTFDEVWERTCAPLLPEDMDPRFWNAAQLTSTRPLVGGEPIALVHLTPSGHLETTLPRVAVRARVDDREVRPALDLVVLEPDEDRLALTFRLSVDVTGRLDGRMPKVRLVEKRCAPLGGSPRR
jgi:hypothetical protein